MIMSSLCKDTEAGESIWHGQNCKLLSSEKWGNQGKQMGEIKSVGAIFQKSKKRHFQEPRTLRDITFSETAGED